MKPKNKQKKSIFILPPGKKHPASFDYLLVKLKINFTGGALDNFLDPAFPGKLLIIFSARSPEVLVDHIKELLAGDEIVEDDNILVGAPNGSLVPLIGLELIQEKGNGIFDLLQGKRIELHPLSMIHLPPIQLEL